MKIFADRHQSERHFEIGDMVLLKLQPYKQATARGAMPHKLTLKYFDPYLIIEKIENVAYHLQFPPSVKIHNVFHVSQLKRYEVRSVVIQSDPPAFWEAIPKEPEAILERRMVKKGNRAVTQWLIKWKNQEVTKTTWKEAASIREKFPSFDLADEVALKEGGMSGFTSTVKL